MKVNNSEIKTVDWNYAVSNEGIYRVGSSTVSFLINLGDGCILFYSKVVDLLEQADSDSWLYSKFTLLPNATLIFDVKE